MKMKLQFPLRATHTVTCKSSSVLELRKGDKTNSYKWTYPPYKGRTKPLTCISQKQTHR